MTRLAEGTTAPDFTSQDFNGNDVHLSELLQEHHVLLVLNRGFV